MKKPGDISKRCFPPSIIFFQTNPGGGVDFLYIVYISDWVLHKAFPGGLN